MVEKYDIAILGGGPAGYVGAIRAAQLGKHVCLIEKERLGGTCLWHGCIPSKTLLFSSYLFSQMQRAADYGIQNGGIPLIDYPAIIRRKNQIITLLENGIKNLVQSHHIDIYYGTGYLKNPRTIEVRSNPPTLISAENILLATGSKPFPISSFPFDGERILSTNQIFNLDKLPESLLIIGAGYTGCELATFFAELGTRVTVVEIKDHILSQTDHDISDLVSRQLRKINIRLLTGTSVQAVESLPEENLFNIHFSKGEPSKHEKILMAAGRALNVQGIGLKEIGIQFGSKGEIIINNKMETNIPGIYAAGDITRKIMLAHVASAQAITAVNNICGQNETMDYQIIPYSVFTHPPVTSVGLSEQECNINKKKINIGRFPFRILGAAQITGQLEGLVKIISDQKTDRLLGVHIMGTNAPELISEGVLAIKKKMKANEFTQHLRIHPTFSEAIQEASLDISGMAIHSLPGRIPL